MIVFLLLSMCFITLASSLTSTPEAMTLRYFNARGAAEVTRVLFALSDLKYVDERFPIGEKMSVPEFKALKEAGALSANLGRLPILRLPEGEIGQSKSIERYVASIGGLMGKNSFEAAQVDMIAEHTRDTRDAQRNKGFSSFAKDKSDEEKSRLRDEWFGTDLPSWLIKLETCITSMAGRSGAYAVGSSCSYADVCVWSLLREAPETELDHIAKAAKDCPTLISIADTVSSHPRVSSWVQKRPITLF